MSKNVLTSFLIGIGFDTSKIGAGVRDVDRGMGDVKTSVLKTSAAIVGIFGAASASIVNTAKGVDDLALKTSNLRTSQQYVYNYGNALKMLGGNAEDAVSSITNVEKVLANLKLKGELGPLEGLGFTSADIGKLAGSTNGADFMEELSRQVVGMGKQQRMLVKDALGLSDAELKLLAMGPEKRNAELKAAEARTGNIQNMAPDARLLMEQSYRFGQLLEGASNQLAEKFLPSLIGISTYVNNFLESHASEIDATTSYLAENAGATGMIGSGAATAAIGAAISKLGLSTLGKFASTTGTAGLVAGTSLVGADLTNRALDNYVPGYRGLSQSFDKALMQVTGLPRIQGPMEFFGMKGAPKTEPSSPPAPGDGYQLPTPGADYQYSPSNPGMQYEAPSAADFVPPIATPSAGLAPTDMPRAPDIDRSKQVAEERDASAQAVAYAVSRTPLNANIDLTVQLDGRALDNKIQQVSERSAQSALEDLTTTTAR